MNSKKLAQAAAQMAILEQLAKVIKEGRMIVPDEGTPMMIGGLRVLITKDQTPVK